MINYLKGDNADWVDYTIKSIANQTGWTYGTNNSDIQLLYQTNNLKSFNMTDYLYNNQNKTQIAVTFYTIEYLSHIFFLN